ncbi:hypothetical protein NL676_017462 [Syzygium grande]|nr:hypothetical protein NL676_017462 [Syzygium grande]
MKKSGWFAVSAAAASATVVSYSSSSSLIFSCTSKLQFSNQEHFSSAEQAASSSQNSGSTDKFAPSPTSACVLSSDLYNSSSARGGSANDPNNERADNIFCDDDRLKNLVGNFRAGQMDLPFPTSIVYARKHDILHQKRQFCSQR